MTTTATTPAVVYEVHASAFHGGRFISKHRTMDGALRAASRAAGSCWTKQRGWRTEPATCCCGGPQITASNGHAIQIQRDWDGRHIAVDLGLLPC
jgi:hypothetical protein